MERPFVPFHRPTVGEEEIQSVARTIRSGWLTTGPATAEFEQEFRSYVQARHALAVSSCTAALHLALAALGIGPGDEVITTPLTFCATVNAILYVGAKPVLADIGADGNLDPASVEQRITDSTRAILPVHMAGLPCAMSALWAMARQRGLAVVEDAAHAVGSHYRGRPIGGSDAEEGYASDAVAFSFYATKNLTTGEGGMVTTPSQSLFDRMKTLCLHGISRDAWSRYAEHGSWYYEASTCGFKYNLSDIQSAIGIEQLRKQERFVAIRARYARYYTEALSGLEDYIEPPPDRPDCRHAWHLYILRLNLGALQIDRAEFIRRLRQNNIGASVHFIPIPLHPFFQDHAGLPHNQCPRALALYPRLVSLPLYPAMRESDLEYVAETVRETILAARNKVAVGIGMS